MHWTAVMKQVVESSEAIQDVYHDCQRESRVVKGRGEYATTCALLRVCSSSGGTAAAYAQGCAEGRGNENG